MPAGTIVASGSLVSPGGQQGIPGPVGAGGIAGILSLTNAYNLTSADSSKYAICTGGSWTLGLPTPALGLNYRVRNDMGISGTVGIITITPSGGTIDGATSLALLAGQEVLILTDGANWRTFGRQRTVVLGTQDIIASTPSAFFLLPPGYRFYELDWEKVASAADNSALTLNVSTDGGNTWIASATYGNQLLFTSPPTGAASQYAAGTFITLVAGGPTSSTNHSGYCYMKFWPGDTSRFPHCKFESGVWQTTNAIIMTYVGSSLMTSAVLPVNAIRYQMSSGNILSSQLTVKGVV